MNIVTACLTFGLGMQCFLYPVETQAQTPTSSKRDSLAQEIETTVYSLYENYFYTQPDSAFTILETAAQRAETYQLWGIQITTLLQAAWCAEYHTRIDRLQQYLNQIEALTHQHAIALDTLDATGEIRTNVAYTQGSFYYNIGDFASAISAFNEIVQPQALAQMSDSLLVADVFTYLASSYYRLQNYQESLTHYRIVNQWLPMTSEAPNYQLDYREALNNLHQARCYFAIGKYNHQPSAYEKGKTLARQSLTFFYPQKNNARFHNPLRSGTNILVSIFQEQQQYDSALHYLSQSLAVSSGEDELLMDTYNTMGATYALMQDYPKALESYRDSEALADKLLPAKHYRRAVIYTRIGQTLANQNKWSEALQKYQQALAQLITEFNASSNILTNPVYRDVGAKKELLETLSYKAEALWGLYQQQPEDPSPLISALEIYHQIGSILDEMRDGFPSIEYKQFVASHFFGIYEQAIRTAYEMHQQHHSKSSKQYLAEAFHFAEKSKSILLLEATQEVEAQTFGGIPPELLEQEREYARKQSLLKQQLSRITEPDSKQANDTRQQLLATQDAHQDLLTRLEHEYPKYHFLRHNTEVASLADVQTQLSAGTILLSYYFGDNVLFAFGISSEDIVVHQVADPKQIKEQLAALLAYTSQYRLETARSTSATVQWANNGFQLYQQLVKAALDSLNENPKKLVIIPNGQLGYLPFDVLLTDSVPTEESIRFAALPYLIKKHPIRYEYSATLFHRQNSSEAEPPVQYTYTGFAPKYEGSSLLADGEATRSGSNSTVFTNLLHNQEEVKQAAALFDSRVFLKGEATEQAFRNFATESNVLHLSMHAFAHDEDPMYSGLVFSQPATSKEDNFLYAHELYNMQLRANLAVLSACETGIGQLARGEGIMSLGRAFKYAGCPNIAMSLWKVNDRTTQSIVQAFFEQLSRGTDKDEALQKAKLSFLDQAKGPLAHPYYWASLVLIGNDAPLASSTSTSPLILLIGLGILTIAATLIVLKRKRPTMPK